MDGLTFTDTKYEAYERFRRERKRADRRDLMARLTGRDADLLPFESLAQILQAHQQIPGRQIEMIPLDKIVGSVGRYRDFTRDFRPRENISGERWVRVYRAMNSLEGVPPIEVYKLGGVYFVADGNHRVSAARAAGFDKIPAYVTEIPVDPGLEPGDTLDQAIIKVERARFMQETGLEERFGPLHDIRFTRPGGYLRLLEHIRVHRYFMGLERSDGSEISFQDAAADWYLNVYRPIVAAIQRRNLLQQFGDSTAADLYVWVSGRIMEAATQYGQQLSPDAAAAELEEARRSGWQRALREMMTVLSEIGDALVSSHVGIPEWAGQTLEWGDFQPPPRFSIEERQDERGDDPTPSDTPRTQ
ncbi:MAG: ParB N-terminal domain-containing protein [Anaerolineae bacterium]